MKSTYLRTLSAPLRQSTRQSSLRAITQVRQASHGPHYNEPTGTLFGEKAGPREREDWEALFIPGMFGGMALFGILYLYKPDTSVQTWALAEAKKKLDSEGGLPKWEKS